MRLPRQASLKQSHEFAQVRREGQSSAGRFLVIGAHHDPSREHFKVGFITTRKIGNAVTRNRVRRRLNAIVRKHSGQILPGHAIVTIARFRAPDASSAELERDWLKQARRLKLLA